ncbi:hypothetical protein ACYZT9_18345 [Pseudomonas sp. ZT5P21]
MGALNGACFIGQEPSKAKVEGRVRSSLVFATVSSSTLRRLDELGVEHSLKKNMGRSSSTEPVVFSHKTTDGEYRLESGLFISDLTSGDGFGEFRFFSGVGAVKYQSPECNVLAFDVHSLEALKDTYHQVRGVTQFLREFLDLTPCRDMDANELAPECFSYFRPENNGSNGFLIFPNLPYVDFHDYTEDRSSLKEKKSGITLGAWAIHPNQNFSLIENLETVGDVRGERKDDYADNTRTLYEIEAGTNVKYLSSILDLDVSDIAMLEKLKGDVFKHLSDIYGVQPGLNKVKLFFHFPVAEKTATLHLHVWVNKADHPLNNARSFELDDIIENLKLGGTIANMVLQRNEGKYFIPVTDTIGSIQGVPNLGATKNPYILTLHQSFDR